MGQLTLNDGGVKQLTIRDEGVRWLTVFGWRGGPA